MPSVSLESLLHRLPRPYRLPPRIEDAVTPGAEPDTATTLAILIESARRAVDSASHPGSALKRRFIETLARLICEAVHGERGDPVIQAMVQRHHIPAIREYASLSAHAARHRRAVMAAVNAVAHPARLRRMGPGETRDALSRLHEHASAGAWLSLEETAQHLLDSPQVAGEASLREGVSRILEGEALQALQRLDALRGEDIVQRYQALWGRNAPSAGSADAATQGAASRRRGIAVEASVAQALEMRVASLNEAGEGGATYRVVTSMHVPSALLSGRERAKAEWDAAVLWRVEPHASWQIGLLVEAKASPDAATTDFSRLLRGLHILAQANPETNYSFQTGQGPVRLPGASLRSFAADQKNLAGRILYCCEGPPEAAPRLLGNASRMQLLSAPASLEWAGLPASSGSQQLQLLESVWQALTESPQWRAVLWQYPALQQVRELIVNIDALRNTATKSRPSQ